MSEKQKNKFKEAIKLIPQNPGVYQYYDKDGEILYVGKAKNLRKRVASYFTKTHDRAKTAILVRKIAEIKHIVVDTEQDALLLENNLIKKYQPRYNVLLKDDKSYPWICIKNERFPRVFMTRNVIKDGSKYFGPYTSVRMVRTLLELFRQLYKLRTCSFSLSESNISQRKIKPCLEYHIKNCKAPCIGLQSVEDYDEAISQIKHILKGNISSVIAYLKTKMKEYADVYDFENAQIIKERLLLLENYKSKSTVVSATIQNVDVYSIISDDKYAYINFFKIINGSIIQANTIELKKKLEETDAELLVLGIIEFRQRFYSNAKEIILPIDIDYELENVTFIIPQRGDKKKLLDLSQKNVKYYHLEQKKKRSYIDPNFRSNKVLEQLQKDLRLTDLPDHIECFDNSNFQGTEPVAACVVFKNGKPKVSEYRHFNIKTVVGPDDFASMEEVVYRRYRRLVDEKKSLPQLIIIDGGKGQLSSAVKSLEKLLLRDKIAIIGIAKKLEEIYFPDDSVPLYLDKSSQSLKIIQHARNEAHRFGITFHRNKRSKTFLQSELLNIDGVGEKTALDLLKYFKSMVKIKEANLDELTKIVGEKKALKIHEYFQK